MNYKFWFPLIISSLFGLIIAWIDSRPKWDDTAIIVVIVFVVSAFFGFIIKKRPWLYAITVGIWIPIWNIYSSHNYSSVAALCISFLGAYLGHAFKKLFLL